VCLGRAADDREPEAGAAARAVRQADERLEDPLALRARDSGPVVADRDRGPVGRPVYLDRGRVGDRKRVVDQVAHRAEQSVPIPARRNRTVEHQIEAHGRVRRRCGCHRGGRDVPEVDRLPVRGLARVEAREVQEIVDQLPEPPAVPRELRLDRVALRPGRLIAQQPLRGGVQSRHRIAQLV
jgi:hypothetical protein